MTLRPYQQQSHDNIIAWVSRNRSPCCIEAATGAGKSHIIESVASTIHRVSGGKHVLCLAPSAELVTQNSEKYRATGAKCSIFSASAGQKSLRHPVVFGTPGTVKNAISRFGKEFAAVVIDECFTGETMVSTIRGDVSINSLSNGDIVCNAMGNGRVVGVFTKAVSELYEVKTTDGKKIRCTGNHPFFTDGGWVSAKELVRGQVVFSKEDVSSLFSGVWTETVQPQRKIKDIPAIGNSLGKASYLLSILRKEIEKSDAFGEFSYKDVEFIEENRPSSNFQGGKWNWEYEVPRGNSEHIGIGLGGGVLNPDASRTQERGLSELLQSGHSKSQLDDCNRSGRGKPLYDSAKITRPEERQISCQIRVESVSRIKLSSPELVYNLHVSGHPSYYAGGILVHNCHGITPTIKSIIEAMREANPNLRVIGLSATPYRMKTGYIFGLWPDGKPVSENQTREPYFAACVDRIRAYELIEAGYLTQPVIGTINAQSYETLNMQVNSRGQFDAQAVDQAYHGQGRKTAAIIADVVSQSQDRHGVMIFAATVRHAHECMASLPPSLSAIVTGTTPKAERDAILKKFKARKIKYLVNVSVLTTGFDAPHVDVIALMRATESVGLMQQIIGRGLRVDSGKTDCLVLDYAENIERHCPDQDIFGPEIKVSTGGDGSGEITCVCPQCSTENTFSARTNNEEYEIDVNGYFVDLDGNAIETEWGWMPAHFGRRCGAMETVAGDLVQCTYRWTSKECPHCSEPNDIAARYCSSCKGEIVDPNEKLRIDFKALKRDPTQRQTDEVLQWRKLPQVSRSGKPMDRVDVVTPYRSFSFWVMKFPEWSKAKADRAALDALGNTPPMTITYQKDGESGFYRVLNYNKAADEAPK